MLNRTFHEIEHEAWSQRASFYDDLFAGISAQAIAPILDSLGDLECKPHLDVACGTGHLVGAASKRGAFSTGIDFAEPMIAAARVNYPKQNFRVADATALPYEDESYDAVTCSFGLSHMEFPQTAVQEAFRVLRPGGYFAFTLWHGADNGGELLAIAREALALHAATQTPVLMGTLLQYADVDICENIVKQSGFEQPTFVTIPIVIQSPNTQTVFDVIGKLSIRTRAMLDSQPPPVRQRIVDHILSEIETRRLDDIITLAWPALLTITRKPI